MGVGASRRVFLRPVEPFKLIKKSSFVVERWTLNNWTPCSLKQSGKTSHTSSLHLPFACWTPLCWTYARVKLLLFSCARVNWLIIWSLVIFFNMFKIVYKNRVFSTFYWDLKARIIILGFSSPIPVDIQKIQKTSKIDVRKVPLIISKVHKILLS